MSGPRRGIDALTDAVNAIAAKVNLPLDLAADLLKAVDHVATERAAKASAAERERLFVAIRHALPLSAPWRSEALDLIAKVWQSRDDAP